MRLVSSLFALSLALAAPAFADPVAVAEARIAFYKSLGGQMKALSGVAKDYDAAKATEEAAKLAEILKTDMAPLYVAGTSTADIPGKTRALPEIWTDAAGSAAKGKAFQEAAAELIAVAGTGEEAFGAAMGKLGGTCKACHDTYRAPE